MELVKKIALTTAMIVIIFTESASCSERVGISVIRALMNVPTAVELELGLFQESFGPGVSLSFPELSAGFRQAQAMAAGQIRFANCMGSTSALVAASSGLDMRILSVYGRAPEAFKILVTAPEIRSVSDLKGLRVGGPSGTVLHLLLASSLERSGMSPEDVVLIDMPNDKTMAALFSGQIDGALATGPAADAGIRKGARVLADGKGIIGGLTLVVVDGETAQKRPDLTEAFLKAQNAAWKAIESDPAWAWGLAIRDQGLSDMTAVPMDIYNFSPEITEKDIEYLKREADFLQRLGLVRSMDLESLIMNHPKGEQVH